MKLEILFTNKTFADSSLKLPNIARPSLMTYYKEAIKTQALHRKSQENWLCILYHGFITLIQIVGGVKAKMKCFFIILQSCTLLAYVYGNMGDFLELLLIQSIYINHRNHQLTYSHALYDENYINGRYWASSFRLLSLTLWVTMWTIILKKFWNVKY